MNRSAVRAAVLGLAVLLAASAVPAYLVRRADGGADVTWNLESSAANVVDGKITFYVDTDSVQDVTGQEFADAVRAAVQSWEDVGGSAVAFLEDGTRPTTVKNASDRINRFGFTAGLLPPFAFASAYAATSNNRITDVDVVFNTEMTWGVTSPGDETRADVQGVATHEWGHGLGLDHIPLNHSTMYFAASYGAVSLRSLESDDAAAVIRAYPGASADTDYATLSGEVDVLGAPDDRGVQVSVIDFVTGLPAASTLTESDGSWTMVGVPPGVYRLAAGPIGTEKRDMGVYSDYWDGAATGFFPVVRGQDGASDGSTGVITVAAGDVLAGLDLSVSSADPSGEPNDAFSSATALPVGDSVTGRISGSNDHDWFTFTGTSGDLVSVFLHAQQLGSDLDARIYLRDAARIARAISQDISQTYTQDAGADLDCRILDFELPSSGTWYVEVEAESSPDSLRPEDFFYALTLLPGGGTPSPLTSVLTASPATLPADGASTSTLTFEPRSLTGGLSGAGLAVAMELLADGDADGALGGVTDEGDGTYTAEVTAPSAGGSDVVRARVGGTAVSTVTVTYRGKADFAASDFQAAPRRMRPDGESSSTATLVPRDASGIPFGAGHSVVLSLDGDPDAAIGSTSDNGDGTYAAGVTAGTAREDLSVEALVDGSDLGGTLFVGVGFPFEDVQADVVADLDGLLVGGLLPPKAVKKVQKGRDLLAVAAGLPADLVKGAQKGVKQLEAAARKGAPVGDLAWETAEACRELALVGIEEGTPNADATKEMKALTKAQTLFDKGEALVDAGKWSKACAKYRSSLKQSAKILP